MSGFPEFELVSEHGRPVAALIKDLTPFVGPEIQFVYSLLPAAAINDRALCRRWNLALVACHPDWARDQLHRVPCTKPKVAVHLVLNSQ
jgi:hypothetical protein